VSFCAELGGVTESIPYDFTMMDSATSRGMTMHQQTGLFIPES